MDVERLTTIIQKFSHSGRIAIEKSGGIHVTRRSKQFVGFYTAEYIQDRLISILKLAKENDVDLCTLPNDKKAYVKKSVLIDRFGANGFEFDYDQTIIQYVPHQILNRLVELGEQNDQSPPALTIAVISPVTVPENEDQNTEILLAQTCCERFFLNFLRSRYCYNQIRVARSSKRSVGL